MRPLARAGPTHHARRPGVPRPAAHRRRRCARSTRTLSRTGVLQIDSVNVLQRAHYMPLFSRMGPYDIDLLRRASERKPRRIVEYWAHVAAFMPVELWPLMRHRMDRYRDAGPRVDGTARAQPELVDLAARRDRDARAVDGPRPRRRRCRARRSNWGWNWSETKQALEYLFLVGDLAVAGRNRAVRARLRPARAGASRRTCSTRRRPTPPTPTASWSAARRCRTGSAPRVPRRLLPDAQRRRG